MKSWTHPNHGTPKSPSLTPSGKPLSNRRIDQLRREGHYGDKQRLAQEFQDSRKKVKPKVVNKMILSRVIYGADEL
jgi:hypothetical protein